MRPILPMSRGALLYEGMSPSDDDAKRLLGQVYDVPDELHSTNHRVGLRIVQSDAAYTVPTTGTVYCMKFSTSTKEDFGRKINGVQSAQGAICKPLDDYYSTRLTTIAANEVCTLVDYGPCKVFKTSTSFTMGQALTVGSTGKLERAAAGDFVIGTASTAYTAASTSAIVIVNAGLQGSPP